MANYGYIDPKSPLSEEEAERLIREAVRACLDERWSVERRDMGHPLWFVLLPGTEKTGSAAMEAALADGDPVGFTVALWQYGERLAFRHGLNNFERWAQGRLEEQLADALGVGVFYDATDRIAPPGTREYRTGTTYRGYLERNFEKPLSADDARHLERFMFCVPGGHR